MWTPQPVEIHNSYKSLFLGHFLTLVYTHQLLGEWTPATLGPFRQGILSTRLYSAKELVASIAGSWCEHVVGPTDSSDPGVGYRCRRGECIAQPRTLFGQAYGHIAFDPFPLPLAVPFCHFCDMPIFLSLVCSLMGPMVPLLVCFFIQEYSLTLLVMLL